MAINNTLFTLTYHSTGCNCTSCVHKASYVPWATDEAQMIIPNIPYLAEVAISKISTVFPNKGREGEKQLYHWHHTVHVYNTLVGMVHVVSLRCQWPQCRHNQALHVHVHVRNFISKKTIIFTSCLKWLHHYFLKWDTKDVHVHVPDRTATDQW